MAPAGSDNTNNDNNEKKLKGKHINIDALQSQSVFDLHLRLNEPRQHHGGSSLHDPNSGNGAGGNHQVHNHASGLSLQTQFSLPRNNPFVGTYPCNLNYHSIAYCDLQPPLFI
jgi:hypothetical protein